MDTCKVITFYIIIATSTSVMIILRLYNHANHYWYNR